MFGIAGSGQTSIWGSEHRASLKYINSDLFLGYNFLSVLMPDWRNELNNLSRKKNILIFKLSKCGAEDPAQPQQIRIQNLGCLKRKRKSAGYNIDKCSG